jgi:hypothetical protein
MSASVTAGRGIAQDARKRRYQLRRVVWGASKLRSLKSCGRAAREDEVTILVSRDDQGDARGHAAGLVTCSSVWGCPVCAVHIRVARALEIHEAVERHRAAGGGLVFVTLTIRHHGFRPDEVLGLCDECGKAEDAHSLRTLLGVVYDSWRAVQQGRGFRGWRDGVGVVGWIRAAEVTYGLNGWHPHLHLLLFLERPVAEHERDSLEVTLNAAWLHQTGKRGHRGDEGIAVDVRRVTDDPTSWERIAGYTVKGESVHHELARADRKGVRARDSWTAFQILEAAGDGEAWALHRWWDYEAGTKGRRAIEWSRGLRDLLGLGVEQLDEDITGEVAEDAVPVATVSRQDWRKVAAAALDYAILEAAAADGAVGVGQVVTLARTVARQPAATRRGRLRSLATRLHRREPL